MKFTDQKPTVPGAYWWKSCEDNEPDLVEVFEFESKLFFRGFEFHDREVGVGGIFPECGLWSLRLVPVEEVEMAYEEGWMNALSTNHDLTWTNSRARRVVEGGEV